MRQHQGKSQQEGHGEGSEHGQAMPDHSHLINLLLICFNLQFVNLLTPRSKASEAKPRQDPDRTENLQPAGDAQLRE